MAELKNLIVEGDSRLIGDTNAGKITASSIVKSGGTSSQFLKADGSVDSNTYATTSQIPTVNNATLTIQKNGTTVNTFTANASSNVTANITVPTKVSELTNDSGYTTNTGTITGVKMNGSTVASSGVADLGTVITSHQSIKTVNSNSLTGSGNVSVGTVTSVGTGVGLTGGLITSTGTIKAKLKEETLNTADSARSTSTSGGLYSVEADKSGNLAVRVPWTDHTYTVNNGTFAVKGAGTQVSSTSANASSNTSVDIVAGSNVTVTPDATNSKITIAATDTNTWRPLGTGANDACAGNDSRLSNSRPASDVYAWAKASTKPSYTASEVGAQNLFRFGGTSSTTKIKIKINSTASWMLCFTVTLYQGYRATKVMISGYQYGSSYWYQPEARLLGDSDGTETISVYFGYDSTNNLWVGFDGGSYTGVSITDVTNGYTQLDNFDGLFTISNVSSLTTIQTTVTAASRANYANSAGAVAWDNVSSKPSFATVATSGSYNDLSNKPTIPTVNNATLTIQKNGTNVNTFTANASSNVTANITVPTKTSELTNDSGYTTNTGTVTSVKVGTTSYDPSSGVVSLPAYPTSLPASNTTNSYSSTGTVPVSGTAVAAALGTLDGSVSGSAGSGKTLTAFSQTDGKVSATFGNISITKSQVSDFPTLGTAAAKDVAASGNASTTQVVMGNDTRLSDSRNAADVYSWAKASTKPTYTASEVGAATSGHTHTTTLAADTGASTVSLESGSKYKLTAGGTNVVFTTPQDIYWVTYGTTTYDECKTAFDAGKVLVCKMADEYDEDEMLMVGTYKWDGGIFTFSSFNGTGKRLCYVTLDNSNWSTLEYISLEDTSHKVSSITSSNISSTTYYPSNGAITSYVAGAVAGRYQCTKKSSTGNISAVYCANGNIICVPTNSSTLTGTFVMTLDNFYSAFMKSIGGYTSIKGANSAADKVIELSGVMANSTIVKMYSGGTGNCTKYQFSYLSVTGSTGAPSNFTYGASSSGCRIYVANGSDVTITLV